MPSICQVYAKYIYIFIVPSKFSSRGEKTPGNRSGPGKPVAASFSPLKDLSEKIHAENCICVVLASQYFCLFHLRKELV